MHKYFQAPWSIKDLTIAFLITAVLTGLLMLGLYFSGLNEMIESAKHKTWYLLGLLLVQWVLLLGPIFIITYKKYKFGKKSFALEHIGVFQTIRFVISGFLLFILINIAVQIFILYTGITIPGYQVQEAILPMFGDKTIELVAVGIFVIILAPIIEEGFFRGIVLRTLVNKAGVWWGSIMTAFFFAAFHLQWQSIIPLFILGLIINSMVIRGRSIIPAITFHIFNNALAFSVEILILKDIIRIEDLV